MLFRVPLDCEGMVGIRVRTEVLWNGVIWGACLHGAVQAHWGLESQQEVRSQLRRAMLGQDPKRKLTPTLQAGLKVLRGED